MALTVRGRSLMFRQRACVKRLEGVLESAMRGRYQQRVSMRFPLVRHRWLPIVNDEKPPDPIGTELN